MSLYNIPEKRAVKVATSQRGGFLNLAWSPDSRWLAYVAPAANTFSQIMLYNVTDKTITALTDDRTNSGSPAYPDKSLRPAPKQAGMS